MTFAPNGEPSPDRRHHLVAGLADDDADLGDPGADHVLDAVEEDGLVGDGHQLLGAGVGDRAEPGAGATGQDEALHKGGGAAAELVVSTGRRGYQDDLIRPQQARVPGSFAMSPAAPKVRVVVVSYNAREVTLRCLDALGRADWPADRLEVVLVDNASSDGLVGEVRGSHPDVRVISSTENQGFGRACNRGLQDLGDIDYVALINNDATVDAGWLRPLVDGLAADPGLGAVCPKVLLDRPAESHAVINSVGGVLFEGWFGGDRGYLDLDRGQYDEPVEVFSWSGAAVLLRAAYLRDVGHFNLAFFLYYEDFELSWRGRLRGWRYPRFPPAWCGIATATRPVSGASGSRPGRTRAGG